jgi:hypothetical protein
MSIAQHGVAVPQRCACVMTVLQVCGSAELKASCTDLIGE